MVWCCRSVVECLPGVHVTLGLTLALQTATASQQGKHTIKQNLRLCENVFIQTFSCGRPRAECFIEYDRWNSTLNFEADSCVVKVC